MKRRASAPIVFQAMEALGKNGVLVLASVTGGKQMAEVWRARSMATANISKRRSATSRWPRRQYPGWAVRLLTHPVQGMDNCRQSIETITSGWLASNGRVYAC